MMAEKDEVLNLYYLFEGEEIYLIKEEPQPVILPELAVAEEMPFAVQSIETPASKEAVLLEETLPVVVPTAAEAILTPAENRVDAAAKEPMAMTAEAMATPEAVVNIAESLVEVPVADQKPSATPALPQHSIVGIPAGNPEANTPAVPVEDPLPSPVVIVISEPRSTALNVYDAAFLEKVLQAVDLPIDKVDIMNVSGVPNPDYSYLLKQKTVRYFISFGVPMDSLRLYELLPYEVTFFGGIRFLYADTLEGIRTDIERKKWLWNALKKMFGK